MPSPPHDDDPLLDTALAVARLPASERDLVRYFLTRPDGAWRECCGSDCSPCMTAVAAAVDAYRAAGRSLPADE